MFIRSGDRMFERSEILKKYRKLIVREKKIGKILCVNRILSRLNENEEWRSEALGVNERVHILCRSMNCT